MMDARFEDAPFADQPLKLQAQGQEDLEVIATLTQDAVCKTSNIHWMPRARRLVLILHRFRWEDREAAESARRPYERVQSALTIHDAERLQVRGINQSAPESVNAILTIAFEPVGDGAGRIRITCAEDPQIVAEVECLNVTLSDLTQPWEAVSAAAPEHPE